MPTETLFDEVSRGSAMAEAAMFGHTLPWRHRKGRCHGPFWLTATWTSGGAADIDLLSSAAWSSDEQVANVYDVTADGPDGFLLVTGVQVVPAGTAWHTSTEAAKLTAGVGLYLELGSVGDVDRYNIGQAIEDPIKDVAVVTADDYSTWELGSGGPFRIPYPRVIDVRNGVLRLKNDDSPTFDGASVEFRTIIHGFLAPRGSDLGRFSGGSCSAGKIAPARFDASLIRPERTGGF